MPLAKQNVLILLEPFNKARQLYTCKRHRRRCWAATKAHRAAHVTRSLAFLVVGCGLRRVGNAARTSEHVAVNPHHQDCGPSGKCHKARRRHSLPTDQELTALHVGLGT